MQTHHYFAIGSVLASVLGSAGTTIFILTKYFTRRDEQYKVLADGHKECKQDRKQIRQEMYERLYDDDGKARYVFRDDLDEMLALRHEPIMQEVRSTKNEVSGLSQEIRSLVETFTNAMQRVARIEGAREAERHHE